MPFRFFAVCTALFLLTGCAPKQAEQTSAPTAAPQAAVLPLTVEATADTPSYQLFSPAGVIAVPMTASGTYAASAENEIALLVAGGSVNATGLSIEKTGDAIDVDTALLRGTNAALHVLRGGSVELTDLLLSSQSAGGVGIFLSDAGTTASITGGSVETRGIRSPALLLQNGASVNLNGTGINALSPQSPAMVLSSEASAVWNGATVRAASFPAIRLEGGSFSMETGTLTGGMHLFESNRIAVESGRLEGVDEALFVIENGESEVLLTGTATALSADRLALARDGILRLIGSHQALGGSLITEGNGEIILDLRDNSTYTGRFDPDNYSYLSLALDATSKWYVTGDSYLEILVEGEHAIESIESNGFTVYYNSENEQNAWLESKPYALSGGGYLSPRI